MSETIIVAVISGVVTLVGVLIANSKARAVTDTKLNDQLRYWWFGEERPRYKFF